VVCCAINLSVDYEEINFINSEISRYQSRKLHLQVISKSSLPSELRSVSSMASCGKYHLPPTACALQRLAGQHLARLGSCPVGMSGVHTAVNPVITFVLIYHGVEQGKSCSTMEGKVFVHQRERSYAVVCMYAVRRASSVGAMSMPQQLTVQEGCGVRGVASV
jgi:hypothetical protein